MFNYRLKHIREINDHKLKDIAKMLNISKSTLSNYESERNIIPIKHLVKLCDIYKVSLDYLFGFSNTIFYENTKEKINYSEMSLRIKKMRADEKISQKVLSRIMKNNRSNISGYELGTRLMPTYLLYKICKKYKISADYLLGRIDEPVYIKQN